MADLGHERSGNPAMGIITDIQRFSLHDGPGIRTTVFLKGCPLRCKWCCNPETQEHGPELAQRADKCIRCGACIGACPLEAVSFAPTKAGLSEGLAPVIDRLKCDNCGKCAEVCHSGALSMFGKRVSAEEVLSEVERDTVFYAQTKGGLTVSGGEPGLQPEFAYRLITGAGALLIDTAIETSGAVQWNNLELLVKNVDTVLYDLKCIDRNKHMNGTGQSNADALGNFRRTAACAKNLVARVPLIPRFNVDEESLTEIAEFICETGSVAAVHLLPYHSFGEVKYGYLGRQSPYEGVSQLSETWVEEVSDIFTSRGLTVRIGG